MALEHIQPPELFESTRFGFTQVVASPPGRLVFVSGQVGWDANGQVVSNDRKGQAEQALSNLGHALRVAGAGPADVTALRIYVPNHEPAALAEVGPALAAFFGDGPPPAQTWIGVQALAMPDLLIEIEAMAVVGG